MLSEREAKIAFDVVTNKINPKKELVEMYVMYPPENVKKELMNKAKKITNMLYSHGINIKEPIVISTKNGRWKTTLLRGEIGEVYHLVSLEEYFYELRWNN